MYVYRIGSLTPREEISNTGSRAFDKAWPIPEHCSPRSESVFASLSQKTAMWWLNYRLNEKRDTPLYRIEVPADIPVYAYGVKWYNYVHGRREDEEMPTDERMAIYAYWDSAELIHEMGNTESGYTEVLIPYDIAKDLTWEQIPYSMEEVW
jgi:hypothetical protein